MREFARQRNLRRWILRVPFLSLSLSSRWLTLITPVYASIGRCLIESVRHPSVVRNPNARELFAVRPMGITRAIEPALADEDRLAAESRWSVARAQAGGRSVAPEPSRDLLINEQTTRVPLKPDQAFAPIRQDRRPDRLVLRQRAMANSRACQSDDGWGRHAARPARSRDSATGKHVRFLVRRS
jgi:hypothetical protein